MAPSIPKEWHSAHSPSGPLTPLHRLEPPGLALWLVDLDHPFHEDPQRAQDLSADEQARAARFHFPQDARRYRASHAALRAVLAAHTGTSASTLDFTTGPQGKPFLAGHAQRHFNLSHSSGWALIGLCEATPIGVDIEVPRPMSDLLELARANFTADEQAQLLAEPAAQRLSAFLRCWTRKEACIKAVGSGLSVEPASFEAGVEAAPRGTRIRFEGHEHQVRVTTLALAPLAPALAAVAWIEPGPQRPIAR